MGAPTSAASDDRPDDEPAYRWPTPPAGGWTADDLDRIPGLPPHTELIDGSLVPRSPQTRLLEQAPEHLDVLREMTIWLDAENRPQPDIIVFPLEANTGPHQTWYEPEDVLLAVEVVSADSRERDREVKPRKYTAAGVPHFWRVELPGRLRLRARPATNSYGLTGIFHDRLKVPVPFDIEIDLTAINGRGTGAS
ncbi:Uma2 family endonuclease [Streptomyces sp. NPDC002920]